MIEEAWAALLSEGSQQRDAGFRLRLIDSGVACRVFAALETPSGNRSVVVAVARQGSVPVQLPPPSPAFRSMAAELPGLPAGEIGLVLVLVQPEYGDLFVHLADDVRRAAVGASTATGAVAAVARCIERWRRFVQKWGPSRLSAEEVRGLIGELAVLARLIGNIGPLASVTAWKGPSGSLRDFELPDCSVEVKTYQSDTGAELWINDPEQLDDDGIRPVHLAAVRLGASASHGFTLPEFVVALRTLLGDNSEAQNLLLDHLADAGYLDAQSEQYLGERYVIESAILFRVGQGFPRIAPQTVPAGVDHVKFSIRLAALTPWRQSINDVCGPAPGLWGAAE